ncbi:hypothetical protein [Nocardioides sp.]|uniref:hypothetical protein n=1 Tax=Nocardioides sp. TaxID=35761 RepID=UPI0039E25515
MTYTRRFARDRTGWQACWPVAATSLCLVWLYCALTALTLNATQIRDRDFGPYDYHGGFGVVAASPGRASLEPIEAALADVGVSRSFVFLSIQNLTVGLDTHAVALEGRWNAEPLPDRYRLVAGRWPTGPREVAIAGETAAIPGSTRQALGGDLQLDVVGEVEDLFPARHRPTYLLGPGTWESLDPAVVERYQLTEADPVVLWSGPPVGVVAAGLGNTLAALGADRQSPARLERQFRRSVLTADEASAAVPRSWIELVPAGYTLPSFITPVLATALVGSLRRPSLRRRAELLIRLGVTPRPAQAGLIAALALPLLIAALGGCGVGILIFTATKPLLARVADHPLALDLDVLPVTARILLGVLVAVSILPLLVFRTPSVGGAGQIAATANTTADAGASTRRLTINLTDVRQVAAVAMAAGALWCLRLVDDGIAAMWLSGACLVLIMLLSAELLAASRRLLAGHGARGRLAGRLITTQWVRSCFTVAALSALMGGAVGFVVLLAMLRAAVADDARPEVLPGQLMLVDRQVDFLPPSQSTRAAVVNTTLASATDIDVRVLTDFRPGGPSGHFANVAGASGEIFTVPSVEDVETLLGRSLPGAAATALSAGGVLVLADDDGPPQSYPITVTDTERRAMVPGVALHRPALDWLSSAGGLMLTTGADALKLPMQEGPHLYAGLSEQQVATARRELVAAGVDPRTVLVFSDPRPPLTPAALVATTIGLTALAALVLVAATGSGVATLRRQFGRLLAIGLPPRWGRSVLLIQHATLMLAGTAGALLTALVPLWIFSRTAGGQYVLQVPWAQVSALIAAFWAGCLIAVLTSSIRLRPRLEP